MPKQQVTIEVDVPDGWEVVGYRKAQRDEHFAMNGAVWQSVGETVEQHPIIVKAWQWPDWLKGWIAMDEDGSWFWFENEPRQMNTGWGHEGGEYYRFGVVTDLAGITPPPCTDWRQSKRRRPTQ